MCVLVHKQEMNTKTRPSRLLPFLLGVSIAFSQLAPGQARAESVGAVGYTTIGLGASVGLLTAVAIALNGEDAALVPGTLATLAFGIAFPIIASVSGSDDYRVDGEGLPAMRVTGWVLYGIGMFDALIALGIGFAGATVPSGVVALMGLTALGACAAMYADMVSVSAELAYLPPPPNIAPVVAQVLTGAAQRTTTYGLAWRF